MTPLTSAPTIVRLGLPKGRIEKGVTELLSAAGIRVRGSVRAYRPELSMPGFEAKVLKPQDIVEMLNLGSRDLGFAAADWVGELQAEVVELLDTGLDPVRLVAAAPEELLEGGKILPKRPLVVASEYEVLTRRWMKEQNIEGTFVRSYGATEVFPPDDADLIVDNTATGQTLRANGLVIIDEILRSSTRLYANARALEVREKRETIETFTLLLRSVVQAKERVMLEVNVGAADLEALVQMLPCMKHPTIAPLHNDNSYAVKAAVPRTELAALIPQLKRCGGSDIVISPISQLVP